MRHRALLAWSGGKDSAWALHQLRANTSCDVAGLFTTVHDGRVPVHGTPLALLREQAASTGLPLEEIEIPWPCPNGAYEQWLGEFARRSAAAGISALAFGDLFLEDIRRYREAQFAGTGLQLLFPLWQQPTRVLADVMTRAGLRAWIVAVDLGRAPADWAGQCYDEAFVQGIGGDVDPCGENGEFHTFAFDGPMFRQAVSAIPGAVTVRDGLATVDLVSSAPC